MDAENEFEQLLINNDRALFKNQVFFHNDIREIVGEFSDSLRNIKIQLIAVTILPVIATAVSLTTLIISLKYRQH